jgi:hypothetical protein
MYEELFKETMTILTAVSWLLAYIFIIIRSFRDKAYGMPFVALSFNICWELLFATVLRDGVWLHEATNTAWVALDVVILAAYFRYGQAESPFPRNRLLFYVYSFFMLAATAGFIYFLCREIHDTYGVLMAHIQNLMMSVLFINLLLTRGNTAGQSVWIAAAKMVGTLSITVLYLHWHLKFLAFTGLLIFFFDMVYLLMLVNKGQLVWPIRLKLRS